MNKFLETVNKKLKREIQIKKWITVNGAHVPIGEDGEPEGTVGKKIEQDSKEDKKPTKKEKPSLDKKIESKEKAGKRKPGEAVSEASEKAINRIEELGLKFETVHDGDDIGIAVVDDKGKTIGSAILRPDGKGGLKAHPYQQIKVDREFRRKGIASGMYAFAEKQTGLEMKPSESQTSFGKAIWDNPNKPFGGSPKSEAKADAPAKTAKVHKADKEAAIDFLAGGVKDKDWDKFTKEFDKHIKEAKAVAVSEKESTDYYRSHSESMQDNSQGPKNRTGDHARGKDLKDPSIVVVFEGKKYVVDGQHRFHEAIGDGREASVAEIDGSFLKKFGFDAEYFAGKKNNSVPKKKLSAGDCAKFDVHATDPARLKSEVKEDLKLTKE